MANSYLEEMRRLLDSSNAELAEKMQEHKRLLDHKYASLEAQFQHAETLSTPAVETKSFGQRVVEHPEVKAYLESRPWTTRTKGSFLIGSTFPERKSTTRDSLGFGTTGVVGSERIPGFFGIGRQPLRIRDVMRVRTMGQAGMIDFIKKTARTNSASPQVEGVSKVESTFDLTAASAPIRTIAHYMQVSKQALADVPGFSEEIDVELMYGLKVKEESEVLAGDGLGIHMSGLMTLGTAYDTGLNEVGDTKLDKLRHAIYQVRSSLFEADCVIVNPKDAHDIDLIKTTDKQYLVGEVRSGSGPKQIWGLNKVESDSIAPGYFLVGAFAAGAFLVDRQEAVIDISFETGTNFVTNEATIRCEERVGLAVVRPTSFVHGAF